MAQIEEANACSGICSDGTDQPGPIYVFSNVNDGVPESSCIAALRDYVLGNVEMFVYMLVLVACMACLVQLTMIGILFWRIY